MANIENCFIKSKVDFTAAACLLANAFGVGCIAWLGDSVIMGEITE